MSTVSKSTPTRQRHKPARSICLIRVGLVRITVGTLTEHYSTAEIKSEIGGRAFSMRKLAEAQPYHVRIGKPSETTCDCMGFERWNHCKHTEGIATLIRLGKI